MLKRTCLVAALIAGLSVSLAGQNPQTPRRVRAGDWPELRGPILDLCREMIAAAERGER